MENAASASLLVKLFNDSMSEELYDAKLAGLYCQLSLSSSSLVLATGGYNDKLPALMVAAVKALVAFRVDPRRFELLKDDVRLPHLSTSSFNADLALHLQLRRALTNHNLGEPRDLSNYYSSFLCSSRSYAAQDQLAALEGAP